MPPLPTIWPTCSTPTSSQQRSPAEPPSFLRCLPTAMIPTTQARRSSSKIRAATAACPAVSPYIRYPQRPPCRCQSPKSSRRARSLRRPCPSTARNPQPPPASEPSQQPRGQAQLPSPASQAQLTALPEPPETPARPTTQAAYTCPPAMTPSPTQRPARPRLRIPASPPHLNPALQLHSSPLHFRPVPFRCIPNSSPRV